MVQIPLRILLRRKLNPSPLKGKKKPAEKMPASIWPRYKTIQNAKDSINRSAIQNIRNLFTRLEPKVSPGVFDTSLRITLNFR